jgi:hypothetical protein
MSDAAPKTLRPLEILIAIAQRPIILFAIARLWSLRFTIGWMAIALSESTFCCDMIFLIKSAAALMEIALLGGIGHFCRRCNFFKTARLKWLVRILEIPE